MTHLQFQHMPQEFISVVMRLSLSLSVCLTTDARFNNVMKDDLLLCDECYRVEPGFVCYGYCQTIGEGVYCPLIIFGTPSVSMSG